MSIIKDYFKYRSEKEYKEAIARIIEFLDVNKIDSEEIKKNYKSLSILDTNPLNEIYLSISEDIIGEINSNDAIIENISG